MFPVISSDVHTTVCAWVTYNFARWVSWARRTCDFMEPMKLIACLLALVAACSQNAVAHDAKPAKIATTPQSVTVSVPLYGPANQSVIPAQVFQLLGAGGQKGMVVQVAGIPVGSTLTSLSARILDSATGPTPVALAFAQQSDSNLTDFVTGAGHPSAGTGVPQMIALALNVQVAPLHVLYADVFPLGGAAPTEVFAIDATYVPPASPDGSPLPN